MLRIWVDEYGVSWSVCASITSTSKPYLSPSALSPLEPYRDQLTSISDTDVRSAEAVIPKEIGSDHFRSSATFLTQGHPRQTESSDVHVGVSLDQFHAQRYGRQRQVYRDLQRSRELHPARYRK